MKRILVPLMVILIVAVFSTVAYNLGGPYETIYTQLHNNDL